MSSNSLKQHPRHFDLSKVRESLPNTFDVIIVGTGAGGGVAAEIIAQSGMSVLLLEEGPLKSQADFQMNEAQAYPDLYQEASSRKTKDKGISILQGRSVGGSTTVNWTSSFRLPEQTLQHWQQQFGLTHLTAETLSPWFASMEKKLSIAQWLIPPNANNQALRTGAEKLGWSSVVIPRNVKGCGNLGYCGMGCPLDAKQSMLVTTIPSALNAGATLFSRARCERILLNKNQATGVEIRHMNDMGHPVGEAFKVAAKHVIVSAGAIGTPAVLLRSQMPDPHKRIGKRTFLHPVTASLAKMPEKVSAYYGAPQSIYSDEFLWRDGIAGAMGYKLEVPPIHPVLASTIMPVHGEKHTAVMKQLPYLQASLALLRDGFNEQSQGGQVELNRHNEPVLDYPLSNYVFEGARHAMKSMAELQFAAGAKKVWPLHMDATWTSSWSKAKRMIETLDQATLRTLLFSAHVMGGANMGKDPSTSVVDTTGKYHHSEGVWVMDGSLFPTSLGVNPQLSIYGLVAKLATEWLDGLQ